MRRVLVLVLMLFAAVGCAYVPDESSFPPSIVASQPRGAEGVARAPGPPVTPVARRECNSVSHPRGCGADRSSTIRELQEMLWPYLMRGDIPAISRALRQIRALDPSGFDHDLRWAATRATLLMAAMVWLVLRPPGSRALPSHGKAVAVGSGAGRALESGRRVRLEGTTSGRSYSA